MAECIFCGIVSGSVPATKVYEDNLVVAFEDIHPKAPIHILVVPKEHLESLAQAQSTDQTMLGHLLLTVAQLARERGLAGYKTVINTGREGGQIVDHLHAHLLGSNPNHQGDGLARVTAEIKV